ncbi:TetR/AcrR family transcriptional regulator [Gordonia terrae]|uniref:TetR/AcrR family transcriptional regulator n=1 Tax=Gordonia terrae TaxID=2055 RepID=UPI003F6B1F85
MVRRGAYSKGVAKREEILTAVLDVIARSGYRRATVRELAQAVGLSQAGLLHYFGSKEQLFTAILERRDAVDRGLHPDTALPDALVDQVRHNESQPGLVQLYTRFAAEATEPDHTAHQYFVDRYATARRTLSAEIERMQQRGALPPETDADALAVMAIALMDGLQVQWLFDETLDMAGHLEQFWRLVQSMSTASSGTAPAAHPARRRRSPDPH